MKKAGNRKKKNIFRLFVLPLVCIMLLQAALSYGTVLASGTFSTLNEYSAGQLSQATENRKISLENIMVQQWSRLNEAVNTATQAMDQYLAERSLTLDELWTSEEAKTEYLGLVASQMVSLLRKNSVTGTFLMLASPETARTGGKASGVCFQDADPLSDPLDMSDVQMNRGAPTLVKELGIALDVEWKASFALRPAGEEAADNFFYQPYLAARQNPSMSWENLGYWGGLYSLEGAAGDEAHRRITYSVPLRTADGQVFGVAGVEVSERFLSSQLPYYELDSARKGGYLLLEQSAGGDYNVLLATGPDAKRALQGHKSVTLTQTEYGDLRALDRVQDGGQQMYAMPKKLNLYSANTPFEQRVWYIAGVQDSEALFGISSELLRIFVLAILLSLAVGVVGVYFVVRHVTRPIQALSRCIRDSGKKGLEAFRRSDIAEVDDLYDTLCDLTEQQKRSAYALMEEKERYRQALQSSSDVLISYDRDEDVATFVNLEGQGGEEAGFVAEDFLSRPQKFIHPDDRRILSARLIEARGEVTVSFRSSLFSDKNDYQWVELSGKTLPGENGGTKIIGSIRNIHEQKMKELEQEESMYRDRTTGLYSRGPGEDIIRACIESGGQGCLLLMDLKGFLAFNEQFGMALGDAVLEDFGRLLLELEKESAARGADPVCVRLGGDEMMVWLGNCGQEEASRFIEELRARLKALYPSAAFQMEVRIGAAPPAASYSEQFGDVCRALDYSRTQERSEPVWVQDLPEERRRRAPQTGIDEVARVPSGRLNMVSQVFNFFERSHDVASIMAVLLPKVGRYYHAAHIVLTAADMDFYTVRPAYSWHAGGAETAGEEPALTRLDEKRFAHGLQAFQDGLGPLFPLAPACKAADGSAEARACSRTHSGRAQQPYAPCPGKPRAGQRARAQHAGCCKPGPQARQRGARAAAAMLQPGHLFHTETVNGGFVILLLRAKHHAGEFRVRGRARVMLRLQAKGLLICMGASRFSVHTVLRKEIRRIKLHAGLGGEHLHADASFICIRLCRQRQLARLFIQHKAVVVPMGHGKLAAVVLLPQARTDQLACAEREIIAECLSRTGHSLEGKRKAAEILGISESTLYRRLRALDLL